MLNTMADSEEDQVVESYARFLERLSVVENALDMLTCGNGLLCLILFIGFSIPSFACFIIYKVAQIFL
jgi:hypothetical protein